jgi:hypothetical protein
MSRVLPVIVMLFVCALASAASAAAGVPHMIFYQGHVTDSYGSPLDTTITMIFRIYDDSLASSWLWGEIQYGVVVDNGLFAVSLGSTSMIPDSIFQGTDRWLGLRIGTDPEISPRTRLLSVPYAYRVSTVDGASGGNIFGNIVLHSTLTIGELEEEGSPGRLEVTDGSQTVITANGGSGQLGVGIIDPDAQFHVEAPYYLYSGSFAGSYPSSAASVVKAEYLGTGSDDAAAVEATCVPQDYYGCGGVFRGGFTGVFGRVFPTGDDVYLGVRGVAWGGSGINYGVLGAASGSGYDYGVAGSAVDSNGTTNFGVYGYVNFAEERYGVYADVGDESYPYAGYFRGDVEITGTLYGGQGGFKIDHPLDPQGEYLCHSFVESPDMKNVYDGVVTLDGKGEAGVELPRYFDALNGDFRYQLTALGAPGPDLHIAEKITDNRFKIAGGKAGMEVSWQVTGIRKDPFARAHPMQVEVEKPAKESGTYLHPGARGLGEEFGVHYQQQKRIRESLAKAKDKDSRR